MLQIADRNYAVTTDGFTRVAGVAMPDACHALIEQLGEVENADNRGLLSEPLV